MVFSLGSVFFSLAPHLRGGGGGEGTLHNVRTRGESPRPARKDAPTSPLRGEVISQSGLAPENFTTLAHFSVSSTISLAKSAGDPPSMVPPRSPSLALTFGSASVALMSRL